MKTVYFGTHDGLVLTENTVAGEQALSSGRAFKAETPDISSWRLSLNLVTKEVTVYGVIEKNDAQAIQQKADEDAALRAAEKAAEDLANKEIYKAAEREKERRKQLLASKS
jgi:hypothetical protein